MLTRTEFIDPKDYPFRHHIEKHKHLDNDKDRHKIIAISETIDQSYKDKEHLVCDLEQLDKDGKYRIPKKLQEAKQKGFQSSMEMYEKEKENIEQAKLQEMSDLKQQVKDLTELVKLLTKK